MDKVKDKTLLYYWKKQADEAWESLAIEVTGEIKEKFTLPHPDIKVYVNSGVWTISNNPSFTATGTINFKSISNKSITSDINLEFQTETRGRRTLKKIKTNTNKINKEITFTKGTLNKNIILSWKFDKN